jgi:phage terminase small subunit
MSKPLWLNPPSDLSPLAQEAWKQRAARAWRLGFLTPATAEKFKTACRHLGIARAAEIEIERDGITVRSKSGTAKEHPAIKTMNEAQKLAADILDYDFVEG